MKSKNAFVIMRPLAALQKSCAVLGLMVLAARPVSAATNDTWTGGASNNFETAGNWSGGVPANDTTTTVAVFGTLTSNTPFLTINRSIDGLAFSAGGWSLDSSINTLTLGAGGIVLTGQTSGTNTITANLSLGATQTWLFNNSGTSTLAVSGNIGGSGALTINENSDSSNVIILSGTSNYSGGTTITNGKGALEIGSNSALGTGALTVNGGSGATIESTGSTSYTLANNITLTGSANAIFGSAANTGNLTFGAVTWTSGTAAFFNVDTFSSITGTASAFGTATGTGTGVVTGALTLTGTASNGVQLKSSVAVGGASPLGTTYGMNLISSSYGGNGTLTAAVNKTGNVMQLSGTSGFFGYGTNATFGNIANDLVVAMGGSSTALVWGGSSPTNGFNPSALLLGNAISNGTVNFQNPLSFNGAVQTVQVAAGTEGAGVGVDAILSGTLTGTTGLLKTGTGVLSLTNTGNSYSGTTEVSGGTLLANNGTTGSATGTSSVSIDSGATLGGIGTITGAVNANFLDSTSVIAPGNPVASGSAGSPHAPGTLTLSGGLTASAGLTLNFDLGTTSDKLALGSSALTTGGLAGDMIFNFANSGGLLGGTPYTLMTFGSTTLTAAELTTGALPSGYTLNTSFGNASGYQIDGTDLLVEFNLAATPEPSPWMLLLVGGTALLAGRWLLRSRPRFNS